LRGQKNSFDDGFAAIPASFAAAAAMPQFWRGFFIDSIGIGAKIRPSGGKAFPGVLSPVRSVKDLMRRRFGGRQADQ
jgi:hypothetical protein